MILITKLYQICWLYSRSLEDLLFGNCERVCYLNSKDREISADIVFSAPDLVKYCHISKAFVIQKQNKYLEYNIPMTILDYNT